jgi:hypothetical protein
MNLEDSKMNVLVGDFAYDKTEIRGYESSTSKYT